ncbi:MAG: 2-methylfumaryl-CoA isomerase [Conexibacter sp.]|jgi:2-methylfumaryl-CoA isomerase|nr:2-methylfumaryl-CoA isomerase [Conexibacter sp.]MDX6732555.1 2-methylfumaryl-CoA isomerase [Baekduia sp.]
MTGILEGLTVVEGSAFVAAPLGGMTLAQLGADVIRFDDLGGGLDHTRWPLAAGGQSLFWAGLNKGKRSLRVDLRSPAGRELVSAVIAAAGTFLTNFPARGWLAYDALKARRSDLVMVHLKGNRDGSSEVDYTVNPATGFPWATGPRNLTEPLNSVLPAWDIAMGELAAVGLLAADRHRTRTGEGQLVEVALSDVAFAVVGHLGRVAEAQLESRDSPRRDGNYLYGAFGHDFLTRDERHVMVVALTNRQWEALLDVTGTRQQMAKINEATGVDLDTESGRFEDRDLIAAILRPWFQSRDLDDVREAFTGTGVSWGPYQTFRQLVDDDPRVATDSEMWEEVEHPGVGRYRMPGTPLDFSAIPRTPVRRAPALGEHTAEVLNDVLGLSDAEIGRLADDGVVGLG